MVRQVVLSQCGINFDNEALLRAKIPNAVFTGVGFPVTPPGSNRPSTTGPRPNSAARQTQLHAENPLMLVVPDEQGAATSIVISASGARSASESGKEPGSAATTDPNPFSSPKQKAVELASENSVHTHTDSEINETGVNGKDSNGSSAFSATRMARPTSRTGVTPLSSVISDPLDVVSPIHDELKLNPLWWLLEIVPTGYSYQDGKGMWKKKIGYVFFFAFSLQLRVWWTKEEV